MNSLDGLPGTFTPDQCGSRDEQAASATAPLTKSDELRDREAVARIIWRRFAEFYRENWDDEPHKAEYLSVADAVLSIVQAPALPDGWVAVPFHCTMEMIKAGEAEYADPLPVCGPDGEDAEWISPIQAAWYAMLQARFDVGGEAVHGQVVQPIRDEPSSSEAKATGAPQ